MDINIPDYLDRDALLHFAVFHINEKLAGDGCSIFLKAPTADKYILSESTILSEHVGVAFIDADAKKQQLSEKGARNIGLTFLALHIGKCLNVPDVQDDERWTGYKGQKENEINKSHCEIPTDKIQSFIATPLKLKAIDEECIGIIRIVSGKINHFSDEKVKYLEVFAESLAEKIYYAISFSELIATGATLSREDLCQKVVEDVTKITRAKGCTIFLINEEESRKDTLIYQAVASTGLYDTNKIRYSKENDNLTDVFYKIDNASPIATSFTEYAIKNKQQIIINDIYSEKEYHRFPNLNRLPGHGKYFSEYISLNEVNTRSPYTGSALFSPLFNRDKNQVIGLIRINKPREIKRVGIEEVNTNTFSATEKRIFSAYVDKLTQILSNIAYFETLDKILSHSNRDILFAFTVKAATEIVGGRGCSILILNPFTRQLEFKATFGSLKDRIEHLKPYEIGVGFTGWVAKYKKPLMYNDVSELRDHNKYGTDLPAHSNRLEECETGGRTSDRFLAVPILRNNKELLGVIRVPKIAADSNFTELDKQMLQSLAYHVAIAVENIEIFERDIAVQRRIIGLYNLWETFENQSEKKFLFIFLTALTHGDALRFNRAILFKFIPSLLQLKGIASIGPINLKEGQEVRRKMETNKDVLTIEKCIEEFDQRKGFIEDALYQKIFGNLIELDKIDCISSEIVKNDKKILIIERSKFHEKFGLQFYNFLSAIETSRIWLVILPIIKGEIFVVICDNIYDNKDMDDGSISLLDKFLNISSRALHSLYHKEELAVARESAWHDISAAAAHRLGQTLPLIYNRIWEEISSLNDNSPKKPFWEDTLNLIISAQRVVTDLRLLSTSIQLDIKESFSLNDFLNKTVTYMKKDFTDIDFILNSDFQSVTPIIKADANKLKEAITSLIKNAKESKPDNLSISIDATIIKASKRQAYNLPLNQDHIVISISDNGSGIKSDLKEKIFQPFFTTKMSGMGLGLTVAQKIIDAHNGRIIEDGIFGNGAVFKIFLPIG